MQRKSISIIPAVALATLSVNRPKNCGKRLFFGRKAHQAGLMRKKKTDVLPQLFGRFTDNVASAVAVSASKLCTKFAHALKYTSPFFQHQ